MTQVSLHYTHTFEKLRFHIQFQSERTFDPSDKLVSSQIAKMAKIALSVNELFKKLSFQNSSFCFSFDKRI